jgi:hypothetical protein
MSNERRITIDRAAGMSFENITRLKTSYRHPFEKVPEKYYSNSNQ